MTATPLADMHVLDVAQGNCAIAVGDGWTVMVDAAPSAAVMEAMDQLNLTRIDALVISHRDHDHARGVVPLLSNEQLNIGTIYISADAAKDPRAPETALLLAALEDAKRSGRCRVSRDLDAALPEGVLDGGGLRVEVLAPTFATGMTGPHGPSPVGGRTMTSNTVSAVLRVTLADGLQVLLPGDIDEIALSELLQTEANLLADVLVFPHHGAYAKISDEQSFASSVMRAVEPHTVLFSVGRTTKIRPSAEVLRGVFDVAPQVTVACTQLSRGCLETDVNLLPAAQLTHMSTIPAAGRRSCKSCAGSISLGASGMVAPSQRAHQDYIRAVAATPMCMRLRQRGT